MRPLFAPYEPDAHGVPLPEAVVRRGSAADAERTGRLAAAREGEPAERWVDIHHRKLQDDDHRLLVAEVGDRLVGFGWVSYLRPGESGGRGAPDGWYLSGVVVDPSVRRRGIGRMLTRARIDCVLERANEVFYVVAASNRASRDLHAALGFEELTRDFVLPGVVFGSGDGILCRLRRRPEAEVIDLASRRPGG